jgi:hypothetical protein
MAKLRLVMGHAGLHGALEAGEQPAVGGGHSEQDPEPGDGERADGQPLRAAGRSDGHAEHEQGADYLGRSGHRKGEHDQEQQANRDTARFGGLRRGG